MCNIQIKALRFIARILKAAMAIAIYYSKDGRKMLTTI
jgi:hypothetical protein